MSPGGSPLDFLPSFPPKLPLPRMFFREVEDEEEVDEVNENDKNFVERLRTEGFNADLIKMGLKVADNHSRERSEALKIGENYIREMAK